MRFCILLLGSGAVKQLDPGTVAEYWRENTRLLPSINSKPKVQFFAVPAGILR